MPWLMMCNENVSTRLPRLLRAHQSSQMLNRDLGIRPISWQRRSTLCFVMRDEIKRILRHAIFCLVIFIAYTPPRTKIAFPGRVISIFIQRYMKAFNGCWLSPRINSNEFVGDAEAALLLSSQHVRLALHLWCLMWGHPSGDEQGLGTLSGIVRAMRSMLRGLAMQFTLQHSLICLLAVWTGYKLSLQPTDEFRWLLINENFASIPTDTKASWECGMLHAERKHESATDTATRDAALRQNGRKANAFTELASGQWRASKPAIISTDRARCHGEVGFDRRLGADRFAGLGLSYELLQNWQVI